LLKHPDGNLSATLAPNVGHESEQIWTSFPENRPSNVGLEGLSVPVSFPEQRPKARLEVLSERTSLPEDRFLNAGLEVVSEYRFPSEGLRICHRARGSPDDTTKRRSAIRRSFGFPFIERGR